MKYVPPSIGDTAFNCPLCGALAKQQWYSLRAHMLGDSEPLPRILDKEKRKEIQFDQIEDEKQREEFRLLADKLADGRPVLGKSDSGPFGFVDLMNVFVARCFNCKEISVWIHDGLAFPRMGEAPPVNGDLSDDIQRDYYEASSILELSPRGASAILRLAIHKLCGELGLPGKNLNDDIGALVESGLDQQVQMALDAVRVIGNNAVHPGQVDLADDRATAETLFMLLNLIAEKMVSQPKRVREIYASLPAGARKAIEKRDS